MRKILAVSALVAGLMGVSYAPAHAAAVAEGPADTVVSTLGVAKPEIPFPGSGLAEKGPYPTEMACRFGIAGTAGPTIIIKSQCAKRSSGWFFTYRNNSPF